VKTVTCTLPGGYVDGNGTLHSEAELRQLNGYEEELLASREGRETCSLVTDVLSGCLKRIGQVSPVPPSLVQRLLVADRQYLLLKLREATFGPDIRGTLLCPWPGCGRKVDIDFTISDIPVTLSRDKGPLYTMQLSKQAALSDGNQNAITAVTFRLPNGADQEAVLPLFRGNPARAFSLLLELCVHSLGEHVNPGPELLSRLSPVARQEIEREMERVAPSVNLDMQVECAECSRIFTAPFDIQDYFFGEIRTDADMLYREVHYLAYHYHWSEQEIMAMTQDRRRRYIEVLADEIENMNNAV